MSVADFTPLRRGGRLLAWMLPALLVLAVVLALPVRQTAPGAARPAGIGDPAVGGGLPAAPAEIATGPEQVPAERLSSGYGLVIVPASDAQLLPALIPALARIGHEGRPPALLLTEPAALGDRPVLVGAVRPAVGLLVTCTGNSETNAPEQKLEMRLLALPAERTRAALELARWAWGSADSLVLAAAEDSVAELGGSLLAAQLGVPYVPVGDAAAAAEVARAAGGLGVKRLLLSVSGGQAKPSWIGELNPAPEVLTPADVQKAAAEALGTPRIRNVVVARAPAPGMDPNWADPAWIAPYLAMARGSLLVLPAEASGAGAEKQVAETVARLGLRLRSVTLMGDTDVIGEVSIQGDPRLGGYSLQIEPCSGFPAAGQACSLAVGRIPCRTLGQSAALISATLVAERCPEGAGRRVVMFANPATVYSRLPLCETVSRLAAAEFKNRGVGIDEFYGRPPNDAEAVKAACAARLVFYQGHVSDQLLFEPPWINWGDGWPPPPGGDPGDCYGRGWGWSGGEGAPPFPEGTEGQEHAGEFGAPTPWPAPPAVGGSQSSPGQTAPDGAVEPGREPETEADSRREVWPEGLLPEPPGEGEHHARMIEAALRTAAGRRLEGLPLVFLQSCSSLQPALAQSIFDSGGIGLIGSTTSIHSASGAAFAKVFGDGLLYRGCTVGEAMRDARNYFLCLGELKARRGHKQGAKGYRVALSFRLWGDPECQLGLLPGGAAAAGLAPLTARFGRDDEIIVAVPDQRLPEVRSERYWGQVFPGAATAGIVQAVKGQTARRLMPVHFFRLALPEGFDAAGYDSLSAPGDDGARAVFLKDSAAGMVWVLYFPEKETAGESFTLRFGRGGGR